MYEMPSCGHCQKARNAISAYNGPVKFEIKDFSTAPNGVRGFPHFVASNGKSSSGFGGSIDSLIKEMGVQENFHPSSNKVPVRDNRSIFIGVK
jgi:glutaredoxin